MANEIQRKTNSPVFAPVVYGHPFAVEYNAGIDFKTWQELNTTILVQWASVLIVGTCPGWDKSKGILSELDCASAHDKPIFLVRPDMRNFPEWSFR